jgi:hypothetical protein
MPISEQDQQVEVVPAEHPIETARRALMAAAHLESPEWAAILVRFASALPPRTVTKEA